MLRNPKLLCIFKVFARVTKDFILQLGKRNDNIKLLSAFIDLGKTEQKTPHLVGRDKREH
jgi:hypothetical protein